MLPVFLCAFFLCSSVAWAGKQVKVGIMDCYMPYMSFNIYNQPKGAAVDLMNDIGKRYDLDVQYVHVVKDTAISLLNNGEIDLLLYGLKERKDLAENKGDSISITDTFFVTQKAMVICERTTWKPNSRLIYATDLLGNILFKFHPEHDVLEYENPEKAVLAVENGERDAAYGDYYMLQYVVRENNLYDLSIIPMDDGEKELCFLVSNKIDPEVYASVNDGIKSIDRMEMQKKIYTNSFSTMDSTLWKHPVQVIAGLLAVMLISFLSLFSFHQLQMRQQQVKRLEEQKKYEEQLKGMVKEALRASESKSMFLSRMSHEIRTPITAIIGFNQMIKENQDDKEKVIMWQEKIGSAGNHLLEVINDILDMSRINSGRMEIVRRQFSLNTMLNQIAMIYEEMAHKKGLEFKAILPVYDLIVEADELHLKQVIINLISNAIKYNKENGSIKLIVRCLDLNETQKNMILHVDVFDTGMGMDEDTLTRVFCEFERGNSAEKQMIGGTGLGLAISSKLIEQMGGKLQAESTLGKGSRFWFDMSMDVVKINKTAEEIPNEQEMEPPDLTGCKILVAEDNEINVEIETYILESLGAEVEIAENGQVACDKFAASKEHYYMAIVMDIMMPVMNGYEATQEIRSMNHPDAKDIYMIALSANAYDEDKQKSAAAGLNEHCTKPIITEEIYMALAHAKDVYQKSLKNT